MGFMQQTCRQVACTTIQVSLMRNMADDGDNYLAVAATTGIVLSPLNDKLMANSDAAFQSRDSHTE